MTPQVLYVSIFFLIYYPIQISGSSRWLSDMNFLIVSPDDSNIINNIQSNRYVQMTMTLPIYYLIKIY